MQLWKRKVSIDCRHLAVLSFVSHFGEVPCCNSLDSSCGEDASVRLGIVFFAGCNSVLRHLFKKGVPVLVLTHFRLSLYLCVAIFCSGLLWPGGVRGEGFQPVNPDELKMTSEPLAPGAPAIFLYRQVDRVDFEMNKGRSGSWSPTANYQEMAIGNGHETDYYRVKVLSEEGRKYADVEIPINDEDGSIVDVHARTIHPDGSIVNFDGKMLDKELVKARGIKIKAKTFALPDVTVGSVLEYYYTKILTMGNYYGWTSVRLRSSHWILSDELFTKKAVFSLLPFKASEDWSDATSHIRWTQTHLPPGAEAPKQGTDHVIRMEVKNVPAFPTEDFMPPENELKYRVDFSYSDDYETDTNKFWKSHGKKLYESVDRFAGKNKSMEEAVGQIVSPGDTSEAKLQKIYARVQQLRNTSYEYWKTEEERRRDREKPIANVEDVWESGYGNSEQLDWLFLALARSAGLEAYPVYAAEREHYFFNPASMDVNALDARLVLVKINGKDVFCDPGAAFAPFGLLPWYETGIQVLRLDKDGGVWVQSPIPPSGASRIIRKADLALTENGDLEGKLTVTFTGLEAMKRRREKIHDDDTARKKYLEETVKSWISSPAAQLDLTSQPDWKSSEALMAEFKIKIPGALSNAGKLSLLPASLLSATEKGVFASEHRVYQIYFEYPYQKEDDITISLPPGWQVAGLPKEQNVDLKVALYSLQAKNENGAIHLHREFNSDLFVVPQQSYLPLRNFYQFVSASDEEQVALLPSAAAASK